MRAFLLRVITRSKECRQWESLPGALSRLQTQLIQQQGFVMVWLECRPSFILNNPGIGIGVNLSLVVIHKIFIKTNEEKMTLFGRCSPAC